MTAPAVLHRDRATRLQEWFFQEQTGDISGFNVPLAVRLRGPLDTGALAEALNALVRRHEALRTTFEPSPDGLQQVTWTERPIALERLHHTGEGTDRYRLPRRMLRQLMGRLERRPVQATLIRLGSRDHVLLLGIDHAICDAWSIDIVMRDLWQLYRSASSGAACALPPVAAQLRDYVRWEHDLGHARRAEAHWQGFFAGARTTLALPGQVEIAPASGARLASHRLPRLTPATIRALGGVARDHGVTFPTVLLGATAVALSPHVEDAVNVALNYANRRLPAFQGVVGCLFTVVFLRVPVAPDRSFGDVLRDVAAGMLRAHMHALPVGQLYRCVSADLTRGLPADISFNYVPPPPVRVAPAAEAAPAELRLEGVGLPHEKWRRVIRNENRPVIDVAALHPAADRLDASFVTDERQLPDAAARSLVDSVSMTLRRVAATPARSVGELAGAEGRGGG